MRAYACVLVCIHSCEQTFRQPVASSPKWAVEQTSVLEHSLNVRWILGSIPLSRAVEILLVTASALQLVYYVVCEMLHVKDPLQLVGKISRSSGGSGFFSRYLTGLQPYVLCYITAI